MKKFWLMFVIIILVILAYGYIKHPVYSVDPGSIGSINGNLGTGKDMGYDWYSQLPPKMQVGDILEYIYDDGQLHFVSTCKIGENNSVSSYSVDGVNHEDKNIFYYCQATWPESIAFQPRGGYEKNNYKISGTSKDNYLVSFYKNYLLRK